jgi:hypothetical protein
MIVSRRQAIRLMAAVTAAPAKPQKDSGEILIRFPGTLRALTRKEIVLEVDTDQELVFRRAKRMRCFDGDKQAREEAAPIGDHVVIEGRRAMNGDLEAVHVIWNEKPPVR